VLQNLANLDQLDFLPEQYRQRGQRRRAYIWRGTVGGLFGLFFATTAFLQHNHHASVSAKLAEVEAQYTEAIAHNARFAEVQNQLRVHRTTAQLLTFLRHPWPRTQILAAVVEPLPESITLTEWHIRRDVKQQLAPPAHVPPHAQPADGKPAPADHATRRANDFKQLLIEHGDARHVVHLTGYATEVTELHEYLARLNANRLFVKVDLNSIEHRPSDSSGDAWAGMHLFTVQATLRGGHGQCAPIKPAAPGVISGSMPVARKGETYVPF